MLYGNGVHKLPVELYYVTIQKKKKKKIRIGVTADGLAKQRCPKNGVHGYTLLERWLIGRLICL